MLLENVRESIAIGFTDRKLSPHAGSAVFWSFLHPSGFCENGWLSLLKGLGLSYIVVARLMSPLRKLIVKGMDWQATGVRGVTVAEILHHEKGWSRPRRLVVVRHEIKEKKRAGGKKLIEVPGYLFQAPVNNLSDTHGPLAVWKDYNKRAGCECGIKELDEDFALPKLILLKFWVSEAALSLAVISYNLVVLFQQKLGWQHERITTKSLRYWMLVTAGAMVNHARKRILQLAIPPGQRDWWRRVWGEIACPYPNCNAVGHAAPPSGI